MMMSRLSWSNFYVSFWRRFWSSSMCWRSSCLSYCLFWSSFSYSKCSLSSFLCIFWFLRSSFFILAWSRFMQSSCSVIIIFNFLCYALWSILSLTTRFSDLISAEANDWISFTICALWAVACAPPTPPVPLFSILRYFLARSSRRFWAKVASSLLQSGSLVTDFFLVWMVLMFLGVRCAKVWEWWVMVFMLLRTFSFWVAAKVVRVLLVGTGGRPTSWLLFTVLRTRVAERERLWMELLHERLLLWFRVLFLLLLTSPVELCRLVFFNLWLFADFERLWAPFLASPWSLDFETDLDFSFFSPRFYFRAGLESEWLRSASSPLICFLDLMKYLP